MKSRKPRLQGLLVLTGALLMGKGLFAQDSPDFPTVAPPTPTAASLHSYGNNSVNYYSGTVDVSIPLYTIQEGNISVPIVLNYTGGNGIKVEEQASWVGLGWALNAGGAVSRTKRGVADEAPGRGFLHYNSLPVEQDNGSGVLANADLFSDIAKGIKDGEPDKFMYSTPSGSGSFFINYDSIIHQKPFTDKHISFQEVVLGYPDSATQPDCYTTSGLDGFYIEDEQGLKYHFEEKERSNSRNIGGNYYNALCYPTTWQMTKITDNNSTLSVDFEYDSFYYSNIRMVPTIAGLNETVGSVEDYFLVKRLRKITHSQGSVEFIVSTSERKDLAGNYPLDRVIIKDLEGTTIKEYYFNYKYLTSNALVDDGPGLSVSNQNRLVLTSIEEVGSDQQALPPHTFTYDITHFLPATDSYSKDHWGYYNGKSNQKLQAKQLATWWDANDDEWTTEIIGSADREPSATYAQAGILKRVDYPTGGFTLFEYEGNTAVEADLPASLIADSEQLSQLGTNYPITVQLVSNSTEYTEMTFRAIQYPNQCTPEVDVYNTGTGQTVTVSFAGANPSPGDPTILEVKRLFPAGNYELSLNLQGPFNFCDPSQVTGDTFISVIWDNESASPTKNVGGVRIAKITDHAGAGVSHYRNFDYQADNGESSGGVVSIPRYWFQSYLYFPGSTDAVVPVGIFNRSATSQYPMVGTAGNLVGYSKVTVTRDDGTHGKSEYYFTGPDDYPDKRLGYIQHNGQRDDYRWQGRPINTYPVATEHSREYLRGKLLKQVDYRYIGPGYDTISKLENTYKIMSFEPVADGPSPNQQFLKSSSILLKGINMANPAVGQTVGNVKEYEIHSGYMELESSKATQYTDNGNIVTETLNRYVEDTDNALVHMIPIETESTDSWGDKTLTKKYYAFNAKTSPDHLASQNAAIDMMVDQYNMLYQPVQTSVFRKQGSGNFEPLNTVQTRFQITGTNSVLPEKVYTRKENDNFQERLVYVDYDGRKNPLEIRRTNGPSTIFVWGYNGTQVIAKLENASYSGMTPSQTSDINTAIQKSNEDMDGTITDVQLKPFLDAIRSAFPGAMVTTFTYDVPIGVTSVTDPRGYTTHYGYDAQNRLETILDDQLRTLQDYLYHYKGQQ
ncbi:MAG: RHS repeat domain-containing protein [Bacteroidota bacterium]